MHVPNLHNYCYFTRKIYLYENVLFILHYNNINTQAIYVYQKFNEMNGFVKL